MVTDSATVTMESLTTIALSNGAIAETLTPYDLPFLQIYANGHISATGDPIHIMFGSRVMFSTSAYRMTLFPVTSNPSWWQELGKLTTNRTIRCRVMAKTMFSTTGPSSILNVKTFEFWSILN